MICTHWSQVPGGRSVPMLTFPMRSMHSWKQSNLPTTSFPLWRRAGKGWSFWCCFSLWLNDSWAALLGLCHGIIPNPACLVCPLGDVWKHVPLRDPDSSVSTQGASACGQTLLNRLCSPIPSWRAALLPGDTISLQSKGPSRLLNW